MVEWLLIYQLIAVTDNAVRQYGPFKSEAACISAAETMDKRLPSHGRWVCVPNELPATQ
jgi:hypothetical protein